MSKVTVVIPVYNSENYIGRCLDSIINQTFKNIDILVDGPFIEEKKDLMLQFRGSTNQRILKLSDL